MRPIESVSSASHTVERTAFVSPVVANRFNGVRNFGLALGASLPLIINGGSDVSAAPGQSETTSSSKGPKCAEVFVTSYAYGSIGSDEFNARSTAAAGSDDSELGIKNNTKGVNGTEAGVIAELRRQLSLNADRAKRGDPVETIILDCSIWAGSANQETSS